MDLLFILSLESQRATKFFAWNGVKSFLCSSILCALICLAYFSWKNDGEGNNALIIYSCTFTLYSTKLNVHFLQMFEYSYEAINQPEALLSYIVLSEICYEYVLQFILVLLRLHNIMHKYMRWSWLEKYNVFYYWGTYLGINQYWMLVNIFIYSHRQLICTPRMINDRFLRV